MTEKHRSNHVSKWLFAIGGMAVSMLAPAVAMAAGLNDFGVVPPPDTDISIQVIDRIFGLVGGNPETNVLADMMTIWNGSMMFVGSLIVGYIIFSGALKTAHEGQALGQQWNSMYIPFRASMGLAATAPIVAGFSTIQLIVIWVALQGVGIADMMWSKAVDRISTNGGFVVTPQIDQDTITVMRQLYLSATCNVAMEKYVNESKADGNSLNHNDQTIFGVTPYGSLDTSSSLKDSSALEKITNNIAPPAMAAKSLQRFIDEAKVAWNGGYGLAFGDVRGVNKDPSDTETKNLYSYNLCGGFEWGVMDRQGATFELETATGTNFASITQGLLSDRGNIIIEAQRNAIMAAYEDMLPAVKRRVLDKENLDIDAFRLVAANYINHRAGEVRNIQSFMDKQGFDSFKENATKDGWALAGSYYARITHMNATANEVLKSAPSGISDEIDREVLKFVGGEIEQAEKDVQSVIKLITPGAIQERDALNKINGPAGIFSPIVGKLQNLILTGVQKTGQDPLVRMQNIGHATLDAAWVMVGAWTAFEVLPAGKAAKNKLSMLDKVPGGEIVSGLAGVASALILPLFAVGVLLAYVLPMIPYIITLFAVLSWFTSIFIAVVAAPLWAVSHATPDGHDAFGSGSNGYILLMSVALRPSLTILAIFGSMAILFGIDWVFNIGYQAAFAGGQLNSVVGLMGVVVSIAMYAVISLILVYGCYRLVQTVPDAILQWIGGRDDDSIGVEQHSDKAIGAYIAMRSGAGQVARAGRVGIDSAREAKKNRVGGGRESAAQAGNKDLSAGNTTGPNIKG